MRWNGWDSDPSVILRNEEDTTVADQLTEKMLKFKSTALSNSQVGDIDPLLNGDYIPNKIFYPYCIAISCLSSPHHLLYSFHISRLYYFLFILTICWHLFHFYLVYLCICACIYYSERVQRHNSCSRKWSRWSRAHSHWKRRGCTNRRKRTYVSLSIPNCYWNHFISLSRLQLHVSVLPLHLLHHFFMSVHLCVCILRTTS